jgi:anti-sigma factor RsiW
MRDCLDDTMKDRLPELAAGRLAEPERARVAAHVETCASCAAELAIIRAAERAMTAGTPAVDVSRIVRALPTPVVPLAARRPPQRRRVSWRIAATIATIAVCGVSIGVVQGILRDNGPKKPRHAIAVAKSVDQSEASGLSVGGNINDLSASQMQALLDKLDQMDAVPSAEPQPAVSGMRAATGVQ